MHLPDMIRHTYRIIYILSNLYSVCYFQIYVHLPDILFHIYHTLYIYLHHMITAAENFLIQDYDTIDSSADIPSKKTFFFFPDRYLFKIFFFSGFILFCPFLSFHFFTYPRFLLDPEYLCSAPFLNHSAFCSRFLPVHLCPDLRILH